MTRFVLPLLLLCVPLVGCGDDGKALPPANNTPSPDPDPGPNPDPDTPEPDAEGNRAPFLEKIGDKRAQVGRELSFVVEASDPDDDELVFSIFGDLPDGAKFNKSEHRFSWTPRPEQLGQLAILTFVASDGELSDRETIQLNVVELGDNEAPTFVDPGDQILTAGEPFELRLQASDPDGDPLTFSIDGPSPQGSELDAESGLFSWTPSEADAGIALRVIFVVSDGEDRNDVRVRLVVGKLAVTLGELEPAQVPLGGMLERALPIDNPAGIPVECSTLGAVLPGASFDAETCTFRFEPTDEAMVGTTTEFAFQIIFEEDGEQARLIALLPVTVIERELVVDVCEDDALEPNDGDDAASPIDEEDVELRDLTLCPGDRDVFAVELQEGDGLTVGIFFEQARGDLDLLIRVEGGEPLAVSDSVDSDEAITVGSAPVTGRYLIEVTGTVDTAQDYDMLLERTEGGDGCENDADEPNNDAASATPIEDGFLTQNFICPGDQDFFAIALEAGQMLRVAIAFDETQDLDLTLELPNGEILVSNGIDAVEEIILPQAPEAGVHIIKVFGFLEGDSSDFIIEAVTADAAECEPDAFEPNDEPWEPTEVDRDSVEPIFPTLCGDADWFAVDLQSGDEFLALLSTDDDLGHMRFNIIADDGLTVLSVSDPFEGFIQHEIGPFLNDQRIFMVIDSALGVDYSLDWLRVPFDG